MTVATVDLGGLARLWDQQFNLLATEACAKPSTASDVEVQVRGKGPLYEAVKAALTNSTHPPDLHLTYDPDPSNLDDWRNRWGGRVTHLTIDEHRCDCGNDIVTTTIRAARPPQPIGLDALSPTDAAFLQAIRGGRGS